MYEELEEKRGDDNGGARPLMDGREDGRNGECIQKMRVRTQSK